MKRHKEFFSDGLELSPVRLLGGFICVDSHIGCAGCTYCLNRRDPLLHRILDENRHIDLAQIGVYPKDLFEILSSLPSYTKARVPVRFGHLTDWKYEADEMAEVYSMIPDDYPCVMLTRFPISPAQLPLFCGQKNLLLHISLTPFIKGYPEDFIEPDDVIASASGIPQKNVLFMLRPLINGHAQAAINILNRLPAGANVAFWGMSTDNIPGIEDLCRIPDYELAEIKTFAKNRGFHVWDFFGCVLRKNLHRPFFKYLEASKRPDSTCCHCANKSVCERAAASVDLKQIEELLQIVNISFRHIEQYEDYLLIDTPCPAARAEEVFLSELMNHDVRLSSVHRGQQSGMHIAETQILERWQHTSFFPVDRLRDISTTLKQYRFGTPDIEQ